MAKEKAKEPDFEVETVAKVTPETIRQSKSQGKVVAGREIDALFNLVAYKLASEIKEDVIAARVEDFRVKKDRHGRDILIVMLFTHKYGKIPVSYSPQYAKLVYEKLKEMGAETIDDFIGQCFEFKRMKLEKARSDYTDPYPRFIPVRRVDCGLID